jgi:hypothetical protein
VDWILVFSKDPQIFLSVVFGFFVTLAGIFSIVWGRRNTSVSRGEIQAILSTSAVAELISKSADPEKSILEIISKVKEKPAAKTSLISNVITRMASDITWDVSGLIGVGVTIALIIMMISRQYDAIPKEILAGWTTILGFYFGKAVK